jgi:hypothetical protein
MTAHPLQNPAAFREARHTLGLTGEEMAKALGLNGGRAIRGYEGGESNIPGPVARLVEVWLDPACPPHLRPVRAKV